MNKFIKLLKKINLEKRLEEQLVNDLVNFNYISVIKELGRIKDKEELNVYPLVYLRSLLIKELNEGTKQFLKIFTESNIPSSISLDNSIAIPLKGIIEKESSLFDFRSICFRNRDNIIDFPFGLPVLERPLNTLEVKETIFYGGILNGHFGHFLLNTLSRLSEWKGEKYILWVSPSSKMKKWQEEIFDLLNIKVQHLFTSNATRITSPIKISLPQYVIWKIFTEQHKSFLGQIECKKNYKKIWLSRSNLNEIDGWKNEKELEKKLEKRGWKIFHPEKFTVKEQVRIIGGADYVAGIEGSAFHSIVLAKKIFATFMIFARRETLELNGNYHLIANKKNIKQIVFTNYVREKVNKQYIIDIDEIIHILEGTIK